MELIRLLLRNTLRHKLRSLLTVFGIGVAVMAFALLRTVVTAWYAGVEASAANRLITRHAVSFVFPLPLSYRDRIAQVPGVEKVTYATWFSGVYIDKNQFFARLAVDSETFFDVYPEFLIDKDQFEVFKRERNAAIIGIDIAERYNLKVGDIMPMEGDVYPRPVGVCRSRNLPAQRPKHRSVQHDVSLQIRRRTHPPRGASPGRRYRLVHRAHRQPG